MIIALLVSFLTTLCLTPVIAAITRRLGIVGTDVHKKDRPVLPEMCGLAIVIGLICSTGLSMIISSVDERIVIAFVFTVMGAAAVGVLDDLRPMNPKVKPLLTALCSLPIILLGVYDPHPSLPFIGRVRLTIVYPLLTPLAIAVPSNAVNMMNVFNGSMTGTGIVIAITLIGGILLSGNGDVAILPAALLGCLIAFHLHNRYPAKVFSGDTGDLAVGAAIGAIAILGRIEVLAVIALFPHIMNAFYLLSTVGGLRERRDMARPTKLTRDGKIGAVTTQSSPVTLTRIILAEGSLEEKVIVRIMVLLTALCSCLAILTQLMILR